MLGLGHPEWCTADRRCALGEHRSEPLRVRTPYGGMVLTGVRNGRRDHLEVLGSICLDHGADEIRQLATALDVAVRAVKSGDLRALIPMLERITGNRRPR
jgi:hypothetical protein